MSRTRMVPLSRRKYNTRQFRVWRMFGGSQRDERLTETLAHGNTRMKCDAVDGKLVGILWAVSAEDGTKLADQKLKSLPVFDGLIAANERLLMSTTDGRIICYR